MKIRFINCSLSIESGIWGENLYDPNDLYGGGGSYYINPSNNYIVEATAYEGRVTNLIPVNSKTKVKITSANPLSTAYAMRFMAANGTTLVEGYRPTASTKQEINIPEGAAYFQASFQYGNAPYNTEIGIYMK